MTDSKVLRILSMLIISSSGVFSAKSICPATENYTVPSVETYTEPVVVNTFTWCLQVPPRCPKTLTEMRERYRIKVEVKTRNVSRCCDGYKMLPTRDNSEVGIRCVPLCENCLAGVCVSPNQCQCDPGYRGEDCSSVCAAGSWGLQCKQKCDCDEGVSCDPVNGHCLCPAGWQGRSCNETCPTDRWGPGCTSPCDCEDTSSGCEPETGRCPIEKSSVVNFESSTEENYEAPDLTATASDATEPSRILESSGADEANGTPEMNSTSVATNVETTDAETTPFSTSDYFPVKTQTREKDASSTARPVIVLVSVPERRRNLDKDRAKFTIKSPFLRHMDGHDDSHGSASLKTEYVKTVHKEDVHPVAIPLDIALIVVASIVSLGLTSVAVAMVLHMRSKLFETVRVAIYDDGKAKHQDLDGNGTGRIPPFVNGALPQTPIRLSSVFTSSPEPSAILTVDGIESLNGYANGAATIGLRISGNLRDLLQDGHYDRPQATLVRLQSELDANTEHIYDEIPLQSSPLTTRKSA